MQTETYIPRRLDDQWKLGFWDADVAAPVLISLVLGYLSGSKPSFALCMAIGIHCSRWLSRIKADRHPGFAVHWIYWALPTNPITTMRATPPSHVRRMVG
ncbi:MAG: type IV conjugative transfer system protein TraL [Pseudomonadota bacterium]